MMRIRRQLTVAGLIATLGILLAVLIMHSPPQTDQHDEVAKPPLVRFIAVKPERLRLDVRSQGHVMAQTEIDLVTGVSGNIIKTSPAFVSGGYFKKGDLLVSIDPAEYDLRVAQAQARVMEAQYQLTREEAEAEQARDEWQQLGQGDPNPLSLRIPQLKEKKAKLAAEQEELKNARLLRQRTDIRAPFNGRVRSKEVGMGQYVDDGTTLGRIYSSDIAEVRLPVSTNDLALIAVPDLPHEKQSTQYTPVKLMASYQGQNSIWSGKLVRSEGVVDVNTGMMVVVVQVIDPFGLGTKKQSSNTPKTVDVTLPIGLFVEAIIEGHWFDNLMVIPVSAMYKDNQVVIIDTMNRLRFRGVKILRREREQIIIHAGLEQGERVLVSGLHYPVEGMEVVAAEYVP